MVATRSRCAYEEVPETLVYAILAAEDSEFFEHEGIDFSAIVSAAIDNLIYRPTRGGSTITQQVVKNAFVGTEVSIQRKITEAFVSAEVERRFPKERILEFYMNSVYFGAGAYGVKTASEEFFNKPMDQLDDLRGGHPRRHGPEPVSLQPSQPPGADTGET